MSASYLNTLCHCWEWCYYNMKGILGHSNATCPDKKNPFSPSTVGRSRTHTEKLVNDWPTEKSKQSFWTQISTTLWTQLTDFLLLFLLLFQEMSVVFQLCKK
jgi:hypothetical protein